MIRDLLTALLVLTTVAHAFGGAALQRPPANDAPATPSGNTAAPEPSDPAAVRFASPAGMMLHAIKPGAVTDYEAVIVALQKALSEATDAEVRRLAASWKVYKASETDAKANVLYVHMLIPAVTNVDYRPSLWLDTLLAGAPPELLAKYRDSFASAPSKLSLSEFADMTLAPAVPRNVTPPAPVANASPGAPPPFRTRD